MPATTAAASYKLTACLGKTCASAKVKVTRKAAPAPQPTPAPGPIARPAPGNEQLPPGPGPVDPGATPTPDPVVPDPEIAAPKLDPGAVTSVYDATKFLYTGANPVQRDVKPGAISDQQVAVLRGHVQDRDGKPIGGVRVTVLDHPELGLTDTRADGAFDLAVNGGGVTLQFEVAGFLTAQRTLAANWQDYETLDDVVMVPVDPNVKTIDPNADAPFQVVRGTPSVDKDGRRQATLLVPKGVKATMTLPDGSTKPVSELDIRATEFTYGDQGDEAMPGTLPANSGYTYAAEFSVDEALQNHATQVNFDQPLIDYTENFIGAPVGGAVPTGYYDRETGAWRAAHNGRVIKLLAAGVDTDGDGKADTGLGMTDAERARLAELYTPGQELWRVPLTHFTPWDHNWPYGPPPGARAPQLKEFEWKDPNDPCRQKGSIIGCETQTLGETVPVTGTGMTLNYSTDRTPGWKVGDTMQIPVVGTIPPRLKGIQLTIDVAGQHVEKRWCDPSFPTTGEATCKGLPPITPNISYGFRWDGLDAYDRTIQGRVTATIKVIYVYEFNYYGSNDSDWQASFSQFGSDSEVFDGRGACGNVSGTMDTHFFCGVPVGQTITRAIGAWDARPTDGLGGWTLSDHHAYDPVERTLHRGDGSTIRAQALPPVAQTIAGSRSRGVGGGEGSDNFPKDGEDAAGANIDYLGDYVRSPDGNLYLYSGLNRNHIFRVSADGKIHPFAGPGLGTVQALAAMPDGSLLIGGYREVSDTNQIWKVSPDGKQTTVIAGTTNRQAPLGNGKPGPEAHIGTINDMVAGPDGTVYWTERYSGQSNYKGQLRKLSPDGIVTTVAGAGDKAPQDGNAASEVTVGGDPKGLALGPDGSIYIAMQSDKKVIKIDPAGRVTRFAGKGNAAERGDDRDRQGRRGLLHRLAGDGRRGQRRRGLHPLARLRRLAVGERDLQGRRRRHPAAVGGPPARHLRQLRRRRRGRDQHLHAEPLGDDRGGRRRRGHLRRRPLPDPQGHAAAAGLRRRRAGAAVPRRERGLRVRSPRPPRVHARRARPARSRRRSSTTPPNDWSRVVDAFGNRTTIERDASGVATAIVAPGGQRTTLTMDGSWLSGVRNPAGDEFHFSYDNGLIKSFAAPAGGTTRFDYDAAGRLVAHHGADGDERTLERNDIDGGYEVKIKTGGGRTTTYAMQVLANGDRRRTVTSPSGAKTTSTVGVDGVTTVVSADGTKTTIQTAPDVRWGAAVPQLAERDVTTPSGKTRKTVRTDAVTLRDPHDPFSINTLTSTVDGATWTYTNHTITVKSAEGRSSTTTLDNFGRVIKQTAGNGVAPLEYGYDALGRPAMMKQGIESTTFAYDTKGRLASSTDAAGNAITYGYDGADRVTEKTLPGGRTYHYAYDRDGNIKSITNPRGKLHAFTYTANDRPLTYAPPSSAPYARTYSTERDLTSVKLPSGAEQQLGYDAAGRPDVAGHAHLQLRRRRVRDRRQHAAPRSPTAATARCRRAWTSAPARYDYTLGDQLLPGSEKLTVGATSITRDLGFDNDRLATKLGPFSIERNGPAGAASKITDGKVAVTYAYDANGRPATRTLSVNGTERFYSKLTFANTGRAATREERVDGGALDTLTYGYDGAGQLLSVKRGATAVEDHSYDGDGNRLDKGAVYDDQDRLTSLGGVAYAWDADGNLIKRGGDTFTWSVDGDLLSAGATSYKYDGFGRRVSAGATTYLYGNPANVFQVTASVHERRRDDVLLRRRRPPVRARARRRALLRRHRPGRLTADRHPRVGREPSCAAPTTTRSASRPSTGSFDLAIGYAGGLRDAATGLRPLRDARLRPGGRALHLPRPELLRGQPGEPLRLRGQQPDHPEGPDGPDLRRLAALRRVRRRRPALPRQQPRRPLVGLLGVRARPRRRRRGRLRVGRPGRLDHRVRRDHGEVRRGGRDDRRPGRPAVHEHRGVREGDGRRLAGGGRHHRRRLRRLGSERPPDPRLQAGGEGRAEGVQEVLSSISSM